MAPELTLEEITLLEFHRNIKESRNRNSFYKAQDSTRSSLGHFIRIHSFTMLLVLYLIDFLLKSIGNLLEKVFIVGS